MANNRVYLRCAHCGEELLLAKYYPSGGSDCWADDRRRPETLSPFMDLHSHDRSPMGIADGLPFVLRYETG